MIEALLVVWISANAKEQTFAMQRFESVQVCERYRSALLKQYSLDQAWYIPTKIDPSEAKCIPVP